jgi:K+-transporting ATPase ATPase A chain
MWILPFLVVALAVVLSLPVGRYLARVMDDWRPPDWLDRIERRLDTGPQSWKQYAVALLFFNTLMFVVAFVGLALQPHLPLNPEKKGMLAASTIFHTSISFFTNNSLQHYSGEQHLSYFSQLVSIVWSMFVSGGTGLAALAAVLRGLRGDAHLGNFYRDLWRAVVYVLLPLSVIFGVLFLAAGTPMTFEGPAAPETIEGVPQSIARGPVAALVPIKNLASVGGGFYGANSAHPFENPSTATNILTCVAILLLPCAVVVMFGRMLGQPRQAFVLFAVMLALFAVMIGWTIHWDTLRANPGLTAEPSLPVTSEDGNLEGKELRFGLSGSATCVAVTTAVSCGAVNCMHDSLNPLAILTPLFGMWTNCVFGGKGIGLINLIIFLVVSVFLTGLMVGRTPEYLGRKIEAREMKLAMIALLSHPLLILLPTSVFLATDWGSGSTSNPGPHGFAQVLYEFSSAAAGNGSGMEGLADTYGFADAAANRNPPAPYSGPWDVSTGLVMLLGRFVPLIAALALVGGLAAKPAVPPTVGTLRTDTFTFAVVLLGIVLLLGALMFLPAAVLGPIAEHFGPMPFGR